MNMVGTGPGRHVFEATFFVELAQISAFRVLAEAGRGPRQTPAVGIGPLPPGLGCSAIHSVKHLGGIFCVFAETSHTCRTLERFPRYVVKSARYLGLGAWHYVYACLQSSVRRRRYCLDLPVQQDLDVNMLGFCFGTVFRKKIRVLSSALEPAR